MNEFSWWSVNYTRVNLLIIICPPDFPATSCRDQDYSSRVNTRVRVRPRTASLLKIRLKNKKERKSGKNLNDVSILISVLFLLRGLSCLLPLIFNFSWSVKKGYIFLFSDVYTNYTKIFGNNYHDSSIHFFGRGRAIKSTVPLPN